MCERLKREVKTPPFPLGLNPLLNTKKLTLFDSD